MTKTGPIIIIEDDLEDQEILKAIFTELAYQNETIYFSDGNEALEFLTKTDVQPFLILSDINMPRLNGFELRNLVYTNAKLHIKCIPYLFFTTGTNKKAVIDAYAMSVQGFFLKSGSVQDLERTVKKIVEYWQECIAPGNYE